MKIINFLFTFLLICLMACNKNSTRPLLNTSNLQSSFITLSNDSSYTLKTSKGARLKIKAESFNAEKGAKIILELKEAYNMQDMVLSGLTTTSDGKLLNSSGMLYINASSNGKTAELLQPIEASIPSETYDENMQLFKGEVLEDSTVNWVNPTPLDTSAPAKNILLGRELFKANCASCHYVFKDFTGPRLAGTLDRIPNREWYYKFMKSPSKMIAEDQYAYQLFLKWQPTVMTAFPTLKKNGVDAIIDYVENEEKLYPISKVDLDSSQNIYPEKDPAKTRPCETTDTVFIIPQQPYIELINEESPNDVIENETIDKIIADPEDLEGLRSGFTDGGSTSGMYDFEIKTLGWYNIDKYVYGHKGTSYVKLDALINNIDNVDLHVYLMIPQRKMLSVGIKNTNQTYNFDKLDGTIPLFLNDAAIIVAFGSNKTDMFYGIQSFKVKDSQQIQIDLQPTTETTFKKMIEQNNIDGIKMDVLKKEFEVITRPCDELQPEPVTADTSKYL